MRFEFASRLPSGASAAGVLAGQHAVGQWEERQHADAEGSAAGISSRSMSRFSSEYSFCAEMNGARDGRGRPGGVGELPAGEVGMADVAHLARLTSSSSAASVSSIGVSGSGWWSW